MSDSSGGANLGDYRLQPDPQLAAEIQALQSGPPSPRLRNLVLFPDWLALEPMTLDRILRTPSPTTPSRPLVPRGEFKGPPRAADVGDLMKALWGVPAVQDTTTRLLDQASNRARREWNSASTADQVLIVSTGVTLAGGSLAGLLSNNQARTAAFNFVVDKDIPVPGVDGLSIKLRPRGAGGTYRNIGGSGVTFSSSVQVGGGAPPNVEVMLTFDVTKYLRGQW